MHSTHRGKQRGEREGGREVIDDGGRKKEGSEGKEGEMAGSSDRRSEWCRTVGEGGEREGRR